jgi:hypothetical protein
LGCALRLLRRDQVGLQEPSPFFATKTIIHENGYSFRVFPSASSP